MPTALAATISPPFGRRDVLRDQRHRLLLFGRQVIGEQPVEPGGCLGEPRTLDRVSGFPPARQPGRDVGEYLVELLVLGLHRRHDGRRLRPGAADQPRPQGGVLRLMVVVQRRVNQVIVLRDDARPRGIGGCRAADKRR
jgi:hypothetical protein